MTYSCPVCGFSEMEEPPAHYNICDSCGTEFGNDDVDATAGELRVRWILNGAKWFNTFAPPSTHWHALAQIEAAGLSLSDDDRAILMVVSGDAQMELKDIVEAITLLRRSRDQTASLLNDIKRNRKRADLVLLDIYRFKGRLTSRGQSAGLAEVRAREANVRNIRSGFDSLVKQCEDIIVRIDFLIKSTSQQITVAVFMEIMKLVHSVFEKMSSLTRDFGAAVESTQAAIA